MLVLPPPELLWQDRRELHRFLFECQQSCRPDRPPKIISIARDIDPLDPLAFLEAFWEADRLNFYLEKPQSGEAVVAIDSALKLTLENGERFERSHHFIESCFRQMIVAGPHRDSRGPAFCFSLTFFEDNYAANSEHYYLRNYRNLKDRHSAPVFPAATLFLPQILLYSEGDRRILLFNTLLDWQSDIDEITDQTWKKIRQIDDIKNRKLDRNLPLYHPSKTIGTEPQTEQFRQSVRSALESIAAGELSKVVLSQAFDICSDRPFDAIASLDNLRSLYPDCYIFSTGNGRGQNFIGASPERLAAIRDGEFVTDALAGSAPRGQTAAEDADIARRLLSSDKDRREHQAVVDFIVERLIHLGLTPQRSPQPRLMRLSNIQHLWTPITAPISPNIHLLEILAELHPTPAAAGTPRDIAQTQIRRYETFDRSLYAAPLGWVDYHGNGESIVGIRSALIDGDRARLFAGAGIVAGSEPDRELAEIQLKLQALLKALI
ncbi:MAG: isochorismate synthase [Limnospira sp.]